MTSRFSLLIAHLLFWLSTVPNTIRFWLGTRNIGRTQEDILAAILTRHTKTAFGKEHSFATIHDVESFRRSIPVRDYEGFSPFIERVLSGQERVLTADRVELLVPTSGSAATSKHIPYTSGLRSDFRNAIDPWVCMLYMQYPRLFGGCIYASISPALQQHEPHGDVPIGFPDDAVYLGKLQQWVFETISAVPREVKQITNLSAFRYCTLLFLVSRGDLRMFSVWHPSYLTVLLYELPALLEPIFSDLQQGSISPMQDLDEEVRIRLCGKIKIRERRIKALQEIRDCRKNIAALSHDYQGHTFYEAIWPKLALISCWTDGGTSQEGAEALKKMFPHVAIQAKGLLATEACVSIPVSDTSRVLSFRSHFFEFREMGGESLGSTKLGHELEEGKQYQVIVTTNGGLYRYALGDIVEMMGHQHSVPVLRFIGRGEKVVDLVGEKLHELFIADAVGHILNIVDLHPDFWMIAPNLLPNKVYKYLLFIHFPTLASMEVLQALSRGVENEFRKNFHYDYARKLGQLERLDVFRIDLPKGVSAEEVFFRVSYRLGQQLGSVKLHRLHRYERWGEEFSGMIIS